MPEDRAVDVSPGAFKSLLGLEPTTDGDPKNQPNDVSFLSRFSQSEAQALAKATYVLPTENRNDFSPSGIITYLKPIHQRIGEEILDAKKMGALAPEIEQSKILVSSSIMSPNDLQDGFFRFSFPNSPLLKSNPELAKMISDLYEQHFNQTLELGIKSYDWIGECQYVSGSKALLILPLASFMDYKHRTQEEIVNMKKNILQPGMSNFTEYTKMKESLSGSHLYSANTPFTFSESTQDTLRNVIPQMESFGIPIPEKYRFTGRRPTHDELTLDVSYTEGLESLVVNLKKTIEEGDVIHITENPEIVKFNVDKKLLDKKFTRESLKKFFTSTLHKQYPIEEVGLIDDSPQKFEHMSHPILMELPSEAVIPLAIPGSPEQHLGYFILLDQYGQPLTIANSGLARNQNSTECESGSPNAAYTALYGSGCSSQYFHKNPSMMNSIGNTIFQYLLDKCFRARMVKILGRDDLSLERFNAISTLMFQRLLAQKRTTILYVPPSLLHYFAFSYNSDGTGVSKLADIKFLLSLRTTLLIAQIIAMVNDAVERKKIELTVDEKTANLEALMELVGNIFIEKNKLSGNIDPSEIVRDIYSNSLTIVPKNIPGLGNFDIDVSSINSQSNKPDDALLEQLNNLLISKLDVPPSALNQLAEPEFARSVVTSNLFFAKKITRYQRIWCKLIEDFIKDYTYFDVTFQQALKKILEAYACRRVSEKLPPKTRALKNKNPNVRTQKTTLSQLHDIMNGVVVSLPKPDIVVDKTQFEEIRNYSSSVNEMADILYPQELVPSDNQDAYNGYTIMKAKWKRDQILKFIADIGCFRMFDVAEMDDVESSEIVNDIQACMNIGAHIRKHHAALSTEEGGGFGDSGYGGNEDNYGDETDTGDDNFGMDDENFGGEDMGGEENTPEESPTEEVEETSEQTNEETPAASMYLKFHKKERQ